MKILSIGNFGKSWDGSVCDEEHIAKALEELGHEVIRVQRESLLDFQTPLDIDFCLIAQWNQYPHRDQFIDADVPLVYWAFDYQFYGQEGWHRNLVKQCDIFLTKEAEHISWYKEFAPDTKIYWLPADFAPEAILPPPFVKLGNERDIDVLFMGTNLPWCTQRQDVLKAVDERFNLHVYSMTPDDWKAMGLKNVHGPAVDEDMREVISRAKINLSVDLYQSDGFWSDRNAQVMVCGGMVLFQHVPLSELIFGDYIAYFHSIEECLDKIAYYLENDFERERLAAIGQSYAIRNLMTKNRVKQMLELVK